MLIMMILTLMIPMIWLVTIDFQSQTNADGTTYTLNVRRLEAGRLWQ